MQRLEISVPDSNDSFSRVVLDGTSYLLRFSWNEYGQYWTFGLFTSLREPIVQSIKIVSRFPLNIQYVDSKIPFGVFCVYTEKQRILRGDFKNGAAVFAYIPASQAVGTE